MKNRNQEHFVGFYRNAVHPVEWMSEVRAAARLLGPCVEIFPDDKIRIHEITTHELDKVDVSDFAEAEELKYQITNNIYPSFHEERNVTIGRIVFSGITNTKRHAIYVPVTHATSTDFNEERRSAINQIPWRLGEQRPEPDPFDFRLRIGTVSSPTVNPDKIIRTLQPKIPDSLEFQNGKIKTIE